MLVFIDESGHPHPNDPSTRPVLAAVCFPQRASRSISRQLFAMKRSLLGGERAGLELKANAILNRRTFTRKPEIRELVEETFDQIRNIDLTIFAVIMEKPADVIPRNNPLLPRQYRYILQRVDALLSGGSATAVVLVDGDGSQYGGLSAKFEGYLNRFREGQAMTKSWIRRTSSIPDTLWGFNLRTWWQEKSDSTMKPNCSGTPTHPIHI